MTYSHDLRKKALEYIEQGNTKAQTSRVFGISMRTLFLWTNRKKEGCLAPKKTKNRSSYKIDGEKLKAYIEKHPDAYLREIAEFFNTSIPAVFYACNKFKLTLKKRPLSTKKGMKKKEKNLKQG